MFEGACKATLVMFAFALIQGVLCGSELAHVSSCWWRVVLSWMPKVNDVMLLALIYTFVLAVVPMGVGGLTQNCCSHVRG